MLLEKLTDLPQVQKNNYMKYSIFSILLFLTSSVFSQNVKFTSLSKSTHIVRRDCELILITKDDSLVNRLKTFPNILESSDCYDTSTRGIAKMYWFPVEYEKTLRAYLFTKLEYTQ